MNVTENIFVIVIMGLILFFAMIVLAYQLGKAEGRAQAKDELERRQMRRSLINYPARSSRRRIY